MSPATATVAATAPTAGRRLPRPSPKAVFLLLLICLFAFYTDLAFGMEWRTQAGRIGPGYFPRIIGILAIVLLIVALISDLRSTVHEVTDDDDAGLGRHPRLLAVFVAVCATFVALLTVVGALISCTLFLLVSLLLLDPRRRVRAVVLAVVVPVCLYLVFQTGLDAGLPRGPLTMW